MKPILNDWLNDILIKNTYTRIE